MQILGSSPAKTPAQTISWHTAIDSVGTDRFSREAVRTMDRCAGVEHFAVFSLDNGQVALLNASSADEDGKAADMSTLYTMPEYCQHDPTISMARRASAGGKVVAVRVDPAKLPDERLREQIYLSQNVCDRVFLCGERNGHWYGISMLRTKRRGRFAPEDLRIIEETAETWMSLIAKHERMMSVEQSGAQNGTVLLGAVEEIEQKLRELLPSLSRRETQVCARILRGMSTPGIALDLELREDSVATYRKRAYRRLVIGTRFELIQRFLSASRTRAQH